MTATDKDVGDLTLYQTDFCPFCVFVRNVLKELDIDIELRDTMRDPANRAQLIRDGGRATVPCLRIEHPDGRVEWMYESARIADYLRERFG